MMILSSYLMPLFYLVVIAMMLGKNQYLRQKDGFSTWFIVCFFLCKCVAGIINDYASWRFNGDVVLYYTDGLQLYQTLLNHPSEFLPQVREMFRVSDLSLFDSHSNFIRTVFEAIKLIHFTLNLFSFGNVYTNTILFNGLTVFVSLRCWIFLTRYTGTRITGFWIFLLPSAFFYTSNILKEGICYTLIACLLPLVATFFKRLSIQILAGIFMFFLLLFFFKFLVAVSLAFAFFTWWCTERFPLQKAKLYVVFVSFLVAVFFLAKYVIPSLNFPAIIAGRQAEFLALKANSAFDMQPLQPSFLGFIKALPHALENALIKPLPGEGCKWLYAVHTLEIFSLWSFIIFLWVKNKFVCNWKGIPAMFWAMLLYAFFNLLIIGYIVPNIGAMVRYRSIFLPWLFVWLWQVVGGNTWLAQWRSKITSPIVNL